MSPTERQGETPGNAWYREPWPWIIIGLLGAVILASFVTLWIAVANPDGLVVDDREYEELRRGLRAQDTGEAPSDPVPSGEPAAADDGPG